MTREATSLPLSLPAPRPGINLYRWLYEELRAAILDGRLMPGSRLPATRDLALAYRLSRSTIVTAFEQLESEGYVEGKTGIRHLCEHRAARPASSSRTCPRGKATSPSANFPLRIQPATETISRRLGSTDARVSREPTGTQSFSDCALGTDCSTAAAPSVDWHAFGRRSSRILAGDERRNGRNWLSRRMPRR